jgi:ABC-type transport system involved in multi-copper enzyme maturation permease subunit
MWDRIENPVFKRELLSRLRSGKSSPSRRMLSLICVTSAGAAYLSIILFMFRHTTLPRDWATWWLFLACLQLFAICLLAPATCATLFTIEKEQRTMDLLIVTRLSAWEICWGKLLSRMTTVMLLVLGFFPLMFISGVPGRVTLWQFLGTYAVLLTMGFVFGVGGMACSMFFSKTVTATSVAMALTAFILVGLPSVAGAWLYNARFSQMMPERDLIEAVFGALNPFAALIALHDSAISAREPTFAQQTCWVGCVAIYGISAALLLGAACLRFEKLCRR